ncbi:DUF2127 domain-containing protein [Silvibacterium sp.]|uniref:DUF2127 domain-containing protein n=1 Tax=Silvibacterium sp. TaxID=1964179 RepID=UPI0039E5DE95
MAIGGFKMLEALLCILLGIGGLKLLHLHRDLVDVATRVVVELRLDPEGHFVNILLDKIALIGPHRLRQISLGIFAYAGLHTLEGVGLLLRRTWAEYVTLILTASFLPWETFEILHRFTWIKVGLFVVNLLVLAFLLYYVRSRSHARRNYRAGEKLT